MNVEDFAFLHEVHKDLDPETQIPLPIYAKLVNRDNMMTCNVCLDEKMKIEFHQGCSQCNFQMCWECLWTYQKNEASVCGLKMNLVERLISIKCPQCRERKVMLDCFDLSTLVFKPAANEMAEVLIKMSSEMYMDTRIKLSSRQGENSELESRYTRKHFSMGREVLNKITESFFTKGIEPLKVGKSRYVSDRCGPLCSDPFCVQWSNLTRNTDCDTGEVEHINRVGSVYNAMALYKVLWLSLRSMQMIQDELERIMHVQAVLYQHCQFIHEFRACGTLHAMVQLRNEEACERKDLDVLELGSEYAFYNGQTNPSMYWLSDYLTNQNTRSPY